MSFNHLKSIRQTYIEHFRNALLFSLWSSKASLYFFVHAFYPDMFTSHGSDIIEKLNQNLKQNKKSKSVTHYPDKLDVY